MLKALIHAKGAENKGFLEYFAKTEKMFSELRANTFKFSYIILTCNG